MSTVSMRSTNMIVAMTNEDPGGPPVRRQCRGGLGIEILEFRNCNPSPLEIFP